MEKIRFSIVVPTRNRFDTLKQCLRTCLEQNFDNYEIIVSDNSDELESEETKKVVEEFKSHKVKYFRPSSVLSMTANYEFALSKCTGEFIICIGDDDGVVPNSLLYVDGLIKKYNASVVKSPVAIYHWKNALLNPNSLTIPYPLPVTRIDSHSIMEKVARFELGYFNLPMIYYSFVSKTIVDKVIAEQGSFLANAASLDMYSGLVVAYHTTEFVLADLPFIISGVSGKSNGIVEQKSFKTGISKEHYEKIGLHEMYETYQVPQLPTYNLQLLSLLELKKFKKNFGLNDEQLKIVPKKVIAKLLSNKSVLENVESLGVSECFEQYDIYKNDIAEIKNDFFEQDVFYPFLETLDIQTIARVPIDPSLFGIENVYDAAVVLKKILEGYVNVKPVPIIIDKKTDVAVNRRPWQFAKERYRRIKLAGKILLVGHG